MAALNKVASYFADEIRDGIAWVIIWKTGRSWHGYAAWLDPDTETFEPDDLKKARKVLEEDPNAVMLNGYYCGHFGEDINALEIADGIRWHYENGFNLLRHSNAWTPAEEPIWQWVSGIKITKGRLKILKYTPISATKSTACVKNTGSGSCSSSLRASELRPILWR